MKISSRLSLTFSVIASTLFIAFSLTVYFFSANYRKEDFQDRLKERVEITEKIFLEKDSFSPSEFEKINDQFLHTLPEETEEVVEIQPNKPLKLEHDYPEEIREKLESTETLEFESGKMQGMSKIFHVNGKDYLIIVTAIDKVGLQNLTFLKSLLTFIFLGGVPLIFITSIIIAKRALLPISNKIDLANSISASNLHQRLTIYNENDELGKMAIAFNKVLDRLEASFEAQKAFIRNASHEIRNPLTAILGEAEIAISKSRSREDYKESLSVVLSEAETLNSTVNNLLQLSKVNANEENILYEVISFNHFLIHTKENYDFQNPDNLVTLTILEGDETSNFNVLANTNLLNTAIINLIDNASKFSSNQPVEIELTSSEDHIELKITDKGIGIPEKDLEKIITPFYRGNNAIKIKGSGIGLSLSSKIIELHKGTLEIKSELSSGTEIVVKLPLI
ncbi:MAG: hypothetical protein CL840_09365 [Crocinitomicaceae bacterium]|nr:hypothetical protein [Crocinitomicaceae bacterium]|tara:strand:+ start:4462 stop:5814 length:1353 start_codon:yes stop_codon:yes gene_type:complete